MPEITRILAGCMVVKISTSLLFAATNLPIDNMMTAVVEVFKIAGSLWKMLQRLED